MIIAYRAPYPALKGDQLRLYFQIQELSLHHEIHLFCLTNNDADNSHKEHLLKFCRSVTFFQIGAFHQGLMLLRGCFNRYPFQVNYFYSSQFDKVISREFATIKPDITFFHTIRSAQYLSKTESNKKIDFMDAFGVGMQKRVHNEKNWMKKILYRLEMKRLLKYENEILRKFKSGCIISDQDRKQIPSKLNSNLAVVKNGVDFKQFQLRTNCIKRFDLLFMGNMDYPPNIVATEFIINELLPQLWITHPTLSFHIAGKNCPLKFKKIKDERISFKEDYLDIADSIAYSRIMLAPMIISIGLQNKVLQAMAMKTPCIVSESCNAAIEAKHGTEIIACKSKEDYVNWIRLLIDSERERNLISSNAFSFVKSNYTWNKQGDLLNKYLTA